MLRSSVARGMGSLLSLEDQLLAGSMQRSYPHPFSAKETPEAAPRSFVRNTGDTTLVCLRRMASRSAFITV